MEVTKRCIADPKIGFGVVVTSRSSQMGDFLTRDCDRLHVIRSRIIAVTVRSVHILNKCPRGESRQWRRDPPRSDV